MTADCASAIMVKIQLLLSVSSGAAFFLAPKRRDCRGGPARVMSEDPLGIRCELKIPGTVVSPLLAEISLPATPEHPQDPVILHKRSRFCWASGYQL